MAVIAAFPAPVRAQCAFELAKIAPDDALPQDVFGGGVSLDDDHLVAGSGDRLMQNSEEAYIFRRDDRGTPFDFTDDLWIQQVRLTAPDASPNQRFGEVVVISDDRAAVSAIFDDDAGAGAGAVYVFRKNANRTPSDPSDDTWVHEAKLIGSDTAPENTFGWSVAMQTGRMFIGARLDDDACAADLHCNSGSVYVFELDDNGTPSVVSDDLWRETAKLVAGDGEKNALFGTSLAVSTDVLSVGAAFDDQAGENSGSTYIFRLRDSGTPNDPSDDFWLEEEKLAASDAKPGDRFGWAVATHGRWAAVGAIAGQDYGAQRNGNVYIFGIPDECELPAVIPTATTWALIVMTVIGCAAGTIVFRGHPLRAIVRDRDRV